MKRTEAHKSARMVAEGKDISLERLINKAIIGGFFKKPGTDDDYSLSWVIARLKHNDTKVSDKLAEYCARI